MSINTALLGQLALLVLAVSSVGAVAETAREKAIGAGATEVTSEEIADLIVGKR